MSILSKRIALVYGFMFEANTTSQVFVPPRSRLVMRTAAYNTCKCQVDRSGFRGGNALQVASPLDAGDWSQYDEEVEQDDGEERTR